MLFLSLDASKWFNLNVKWEGICPLAAVRSISKSGGRQARSKACVQGVRCRRAVACQGQEKTNTCTAISLTAPALFSLSLSCCVCLFCDDLSLSGICLDTPLFIGFNRTCLSAAPSLSLSFSCMQMCFSFTPALFTLDSALWAQLSLHALVE